MANTSNITSVAPFLGEHPNTMDGNPTPAPKPVDIVLQLIGEEALDLIRMEILPRVEYALGSMGVFNNILTLIVYSKMGFKETANITLIAIAFWDLITCMSIFLHCARNILELAFPHLSKSFMYSFFYSLVFIKQFTRGSVHTSNVLAAYMSIERGLCVAMPFAVKHLFTRKFVIVTCLAISVFVNGTFSLTYVTKKFIRIRTRTLSFIYFPYPTQFNIDNKDWLDLYANIINQVYPFATLVISGASTVIIIYQLRKSSKLRSKMSASGSNGLPARDVKVAKMLVVVIGVYIVYALPTVSANLAFSIYPMIKYNQYSMLVGLINDYVVIVTALNASVNIFIFFFMSSGFNQTLKKLFRIPEKTKRIKK